MNLFEQAINYLDTLPVFSPAAIADKTQVMALDQLNILLERLDHPENKLKFVHVGGTNGKGSTCAFLRQILTHAGYKTGSFTSPELYRITERIRINGEEISKEDFGRLMQIVIHKVEEMKEEGLKSPSPFEIVLAMGFLYYLEQNCDIVILEVGLGGIDDATNVIPSPLLAILTTISLDHTEILGNCLEEIAQKKAGIIKKDSSVLLYPQTESVSAVIQDHCKKVNANLIFAQLPSKFDFLSLEKQCFSFRGEKYEIGLLGNYQSNNAAMAIQAASILNQKGFSISQSAIKEGLKQAKWPARFELIKKDPIIFLDGGHNPEGSRALVDSFKALYPNKKITFIVGILCDKDYLSMLNILAEIANEFYTIPVPSPRALLASKLADEINNGIGKATAFDSLESALNHLSKNEIYCICGSLYLNKGIKF